MSQVSTVVISLRHFSVIPFSVFGLTNMVNYMSEITSFLSHPFFWIDKYGQLYVRIDIISQSSLFFGLTSSHFSSSFLSHPFFCFWIDKYGQLYVRIDVISQSSLFLFWIDKYGQLYVRIDVISQSSLFLFLD